MPAIAAAGIGAAGSILGGITGGKGAAKAAEAQAQAQQQQLALAKQEFGTISTDAQPTISAGNSATSSLLDLLGLGTNSTGTPGQAQASAINGLQQSPLYQSQFNAGLQGVDQSAAASGGLRGGNGALAQSSFGSNLLSQIYQQQIGNLSNVVGQGNSALGTLSGAGSSYVNASGSANSALGNANGTAAAAPYAAFQQALSGLGSAYGSTGVNSGVVGSGYIPTTTSAAPTVSGIIGGNLGYSGRF